MTILYVGAVSPHKGVHILLDAFRLVAARRADVRLLVVGPPGHYPIPDTFELPDPEVVASLRPWFSAPIGRLLREKIDREFAAETAGSVTFTGAIPREALVGAYLDADVFAFPPIWDEGFAIPPVEAMAAGTPVVATRSGALVETVVDGSTGLLVPKGDSETLAAALLQLLDDDEARERMGRAGRERARSRYRWTAAATAERDAYGAWRAGGPARN